MIVLIVGLSWFLFSFIYIFPSNKILSLSSCIANYAKQFTDCDRVDETKMTHLFVQINKNEKVLHYLHKFLVFLIVGDLVLKILRIRMKKFLLFFFSRLIMNLSAAYSSCPQSCSHVICIGEKALTNFCKSGVVMDSCNCCHVCAKTEGDLCGGYMDIQGKCREEFHCQLDKENIGHCRGM